MKPVYFTPGPSELYFTVRDHLRTALRLGIPSIYHRSESFKKLFAATNEGLRQLLNLPDDYRIAFTSSATEIWERAALNLIDQEASFVVNGAFSERFAQVAEQWGKKAHRMELAEGRGYDGITPLPSNSFIGITHNETSMGVRTPLDSIYKIKADHPDSLVAVDIVSSIPAENIDFSQIDMAYFSVQKGMGLPAGLGVWLYNQKCLDRAIELENKGQKTGSYHKLTRLAKMADSNQTPSTPNILGIYLLQKVVEDMLTKGLDMVQREIKYKSAVLYHAFENHPELEAFVTEKEFRSPTTLVAKVSDSGLWKKKLLDSNFFIGQGYGAHKDHHIRIANFPTHSKEQVELLSDEIVKVSLKG